MKREHTATVFIFQQRKTLLLKHKKYHKWLPPGGHLEPNELPHECALREAKEETGLEIALIPQENIWIEPNGKGESIFRPYLCLLETIAATSLSSAHQHIDFIFVGYPLKEVGMSYDAEMRWFSLQEIEALGEEVFSEIAPIVAQIYRDFPSHRACSQT